MSLNIFSLHATILFAENKFMTTIGLLGKKIGMTQIFNSKGDTIPVTILKLGPCTITQVKTVDTDGYNAIQIGHHIVPSKKLSKCELGHLKKFNLPKFKDLKEFRVESCEGFNVGQTIAIDKLQIGDCINVTANSIGKGFAGYQKRHRFTRGPMSHGSKNHRQPGSIGAGTTPGRVFPGKRMAGRMGMQQVTIRNLKVVGIKAEDNILLVKGSIPGKAGNFISIKHNNHDK